MDCNCSFSLAEKGTEAEGVDHLPVFLTEQADYLGFICMLPSFEVKRSTFRGSGQSTAVKPIGRRRQAI